MAWAADSGWIDVQSNSWLSLVPPPVETSVGSAFADASTKTFTIAASGNGAAYIAGLVPTPTYVLSTAAPGVVLVGGHDNGRTTLWSGSPPHVIADAYAGMTAIHNSVEKMKPAPIACCTSASAPYAAGGATAIVLEARRILGHRGSGFDDGIVATGPPGTVAKGPLEDGCFTIDELRDVFFKTADARPGEGRDDGEVHWSGEPRGPEVTPYGPGDNPFCLLCTTTPIPWSAVPEAVNAYPLLGYGAINETSLDLAFQVLRGDADLPDRALEDQQYQADQEARRQYYAGSEGQSAAMCAAAEPAS